MEWKGNVHYHVHKTPLLARILGYKNPFNLNPSSLFNTHFNIIKIDTMAYINHFSLPDYHNAIFIAWKIIHKQQRKQIKSTVIRPQDS
jgi:hypothetical protein